MGITDSDNESGGRSKLASVAFTAIGLAFFFGVGLAGGAAYKIYFSDDGGTQTAVRSRPPLAPSATPPDQIAAASAPSAAEKPAADSPPIEAAAQPAPADAAEPTMMAQAAAPPAPEPAAATSSDAPAAPAESLAAPDAPIPPAQPDTQAAVQSVEPQPAAAMRPQKKSAPAAKATPTPRSAALHPPAAAHDSAAGSFRVQFGAFASEDNARHLQSTLEAAGLKVVVSRDQAPSGNQLFYVRSPSYPDRAAALSAAQNVQNRAQHLANPIRIDYAIIADHAAGEQHAQR